MKPPAAWRVLSILVWLAAAPVLATTYTNAINDSSWRAASSVFECRLEHEVPYFGKAVFSTRAGEGSRFFINGSVSRFAAGQAEVIAKPPVWLNSYEDESLGMVPVKQGRNPMWLDARYAEKYLAELNSGKELEFVRKAWYEDNSRPSARLALSTIGFKTAYRSYLGCLAGLLPESFHQLERTALYFGVNVPEESDELSPAIRRKLDNVLSLVKHDNKIRRFYVDGHASAPGERADNLELSKRRAELVADYLKRRGIPEDWLVVRWHGERYPVASNANASGRAKNRRVTLRLERVEEIEVLPLAANK